MVSVTIVLQCRPGLCFWPRILAVVSFELLLGKNATHIGALLNLKITHPQSQLLSGSSPHRASMYSVIIFTVSVALAWHELLYGSSGLT
ncbi:hypothetical protein Tco_1439585 [Tanacetum coccineum]